MNRTARAKINRENARHSTGPKTEEGKNRSRLNALKHGLCAQALALPSEDAAVLQDRLDEWTDAYGPETPGERALVERAALATVQLHRCALFQAAAVGEQVRQAGEGWDRAREEDVARHAARLADDPAAALRGLKATSEGCSWLLNRWDGLQYKLESISAALAPSDRDLATRLQGWKPEDFRTDSNVYWFRLINLCTAEEPNAEALAWLFDPKQMPDTLRWLLRDGVPCAEHSRDELARTVRDQIEELKARADRLRAEIDEPSRAGAADRALLLDGPEGALLLRYERAHDSAFHRAYKGILQAQKEADAHDEEAASPPGVVPDVPAPPSSTPSVPAAPPARNEASSAHEPTLSLYTDGGCVDNSPSFPAFGGRDVMIPAVVTTGPAGMPTAT